MIEILFLMLAAFGAGIVNALAGGGTFLTFPALVFTGVPPVIANATSTVAVFPGYLGGALGYGRDLKTFARQELVRLTVITFAGGLVGSLLVLVSSNEAFSAVVPFLLLIATISFMYGDQIRALSQKHAGGVTPQGAIGLFCVSVYGGYFNGGLGIILLALFSLWGMTNINRMNGLKMGLSCALSAISVTAFVVAGIVEWPQAVVMMVASTLGGYLGAPLARALPDAVVRGFVIAMGFTMSAVFFWRFFAG